MTHPAREDPRWPKVQWLIVVGLIVLIQVALIYMAADPPPTSARVSGPTGKIYLVAGTEWEDELMATMAVRDPTLFARANARSFTGPLWQKLSPSPHPYRDWTEPAQFLNYSNLDLSPGGALQLFVKTNIAQFSIQQPMPAPANDQGALGPPLITNQSTLELGGGIKHRNLLVNVGLRDWPHTNFIAPTVVSVGVNRLGRVMVARLDSRRNPSRGRLATTSPAQHPEADAFALKWAKAALFEPLEPAEANGSDELSWGELVFHWRAVFPTNSAAANTNQPVNSNNP